jgi:hypothetical protein
MFREDHLIGYPDKIFHLHPGLSKMIENDQSRNSGEFRTFRETISSSLNCLELHIVQICVPVSVFCKV